MSNDIFSVGDYTFTSRLFLGTGKYPDAQTMVDALDVSGTECVTVAVRRIDLSDTSENNWFSHLDRDRYTLLPNTAGCFNMEDALRTCRLAREAGLSDLVKLEILGDKDTLYPDVHATVEAAEILVKEGFTVLAYTSDDLITALKLQDAGVASVMPLGSPIGSGLGLLNPLNIQIIKERLDVPVIVDAGVGTASDVAVAMELGVDGVLMNTGIACAQDPVNMARAMKLACESGRLAWRSGRIEKKVYGAPSSPVEGTISS
jgi:thiazole synthase